MASTYHFKQKQAAIRQAWSLRDDYKHVSVNDGHLEYVVTYCCSTDPQQATLEQKMNVKCQNRPITLTT